MDSEQGMTLSRPAAYRPSTVVESHNASVDRTDDQNDSVSLTSAEEDDEEHSSSLASDKHDAEDSSLLAPDEEDAEDDSGSLASAEEERVLSRLEALPAEISLTIFRAFFGGIVLIPIVNEQQDALFDESRLALLLMSKSHTQMIRMALWECATVLVKCPISLGSLHLGAYPLDRIQRFQVHIDHAHQTPPFLLMSRILRSLPNLQSLRLIMAGPDLKISQPMLLAETSVATSHLTRAAEKLLHTISYDATWLLKLVTDAIDPHYALNVEIEFYLRTEEDSDRIFGRRRNIFLLHTAVSNLEQFHVPVVYSVKTQTLTGTHKDTHFSIPQQPFNVARSHWAAQDVLADHSAAEDGVWNIVRGQFAHVKMSAHLVWRLYELMSEELFQSTNGSPPADSEQLAWKIGLAVWESQDDAYLGDCPCYDEHYGSLECYKPEPPQLYDIWRRTLKVDDQQVLARPWRTAYDLVGRIEARAERPNEMDYEQQEAFFTHLFDPNRKWVDE
jgi:hypothetical protein